jgi:hypothetical protein
MLFCGPGSLRACGRGLGAEKVKHIAETRRFGGEFYRRQSALRTIKGGICWGLGFRRVLLTQLLLLGYQRIVKGPGLKVNPFFFSLPNITSPYEIYDWRLPIENHKSKII